MHSKHSMTDSFADRGPYIHDGLGMVPQTRQLVGGLQTAHRPGKTLQDRCGSHVAQTSALHLTELVALREHFESILEENGDEGRWEKCISGYYLEDTSIIRRPYYMTCNFFKQGREDSGKEARRSEDMSGVHLHVRCTDPCKKPELPAVSSYFLYHSSLFVPLSLYSRTCSMFPSGWLGRDSEGLRTPGTWHFFKLVYNRIPKDGGWVSSCGTNKSRRDPTKSTPVKC